MKPTAKASECQSFMEREAFQYLFNRWVHRIESATQICVDGPPEEVDYNNLISARATIQAYRSVIKDFERLANERDDSDESE